MKKPSSALVLLFVITYLILLSSNFPHNNPIELAGQKNGDCSKVIPVISVAEDQFGSLHPYYVQSQTITIIGSQATPVDIFRFSLAILNGDEDPFSRSTEIEAPKIYIWQPQGFHTHFACLLVVLDLEGCPFILWAIYKMGKKQKQNQEYTVYMLR